MKMKMTKKKILETNQIVLQVGYCKLQNLLQLREPYAYTCGNDGWHADIYDYGTVAICTGSQPFGKKVPYDLCKKWNNVAMEYLKESTKSYSEKKEYLDILIGEFIEEAKTL